MRYYEPSAEASSREKTDLPREGFGMGNMHGASLRGGGGGAVRTEILFVQIGVGWGKERETKRGVHKGGKDGNSMVQPTLCRLKVLGSIPHSTR